MTQTVIYTEFGNKYSKGKQVCNPFWVVAFLVTKFPKELILVHKMQRNSEQPQQNILHLR